MKMISLNATLIVQILNFLILVWILKYVLVKPVLNILDKREQYKKDLLAEIGTLERETTETAERCESKIHSAKTEALQQAALILEDARKECKGILDVARLESYSIVSAVEKEIRVETERVRQVLHKEMEQWAHAIAIKTLGKEV